MNKTTVANTTLTKAPLLDEAKTLQAIKLAHKAIDNRIYPVANVVTAALLAIYFDHDLVPAPDLNAVWETDDPDGFDPAVIRFDIAVLQYKAFGQRLQKLATPAPLIEHNVAKALLKTASIRKRNGHRRKGKAFRPATPEWLWQELIKIAPLAHWEEWSKIYLNLAECGDIFRNAPTS